MRAHGQRYRSGALAAPVLVACLGVARLHASTAAAVDAPDLHADVRQAVAAGNREAALASLSALAARDPAAYAANSYPYLEGVLAGTSGDLSRAVEALRAVAASPGPLRDRASLKLAVLLEAGFPRQALHHVEGFGKRFPGSTLTGKASVLEVVLHARTGDWAGADRLAAALGRGLRREAEAQVFAVARDGGFRGEARARARRLLRGRTSDDAATEAAAYLVSAGPSELPVEEAWPLARTLVASRSFAPGMVELERVAAASPALRSEALLLLARAASKAGDEGRAREALARVAAMPGGARDRVDLQLARMAMLCGDVEEASERLRAVVAESEARSNAAGQAWMRLARIQSGARDLEEARRSLGEVVRLFGASSSYSIESAIHVAGAALAVGDGEGALRDLGLVSTTREERVRDLAYWRGVAHERAGQPAEAVAELRAAARGRDLLAGLSRERLSRLPGGPGQATAALVASARVAMAKGDHEGARRLLGQALGEGPAGDLEREVLALLGEAYRALPGYREAFALALDPPRAPRTGEAALASVALAPAEAPLAAAAAAPAARRGGKPARAAAVPGVDHAAAAEELRFLGLDAEASSALRAMGVGRGDLHGLYTVAELARRGGDARVAVAWAERIVSTLPGGFARGCLPREVVRLLYPDPYASLVEEMARARGLDPDIVRSVMREESRFDPSAVSPAGARGLMQFIPETARRVGDEIGLVVRDFSDVQEPAVAIPLGAAYLAGLLRLFDGNEGAAVAAYNAGEEVSFSWLARTRDGVLDEFLREIEYAETRTYVDRVLTSLAAYRAQSAHEAAN